MKRDRRRAAAELAVPPEVLAALGGALDLERIARGVAALNLGLTQDRERFLARSYLADAELRLAYRTYYLCANLPKLAPILDRLAAHLPERFSVLELGAGPGTGVAGVGLWARDNHRHVRHHAVDTVAANGQATQELAKALGLSEVSTSTADIAGGLPPGPPADLVLFMNVINELPTSADAALVRSLPSRLTPGGLILVIEPAERAASQRALALRDALVAAGLALVAPCPAGGRCPALASDDWCHDEWPFDRPEFMAAVDARVGTRREVLKATWFAARAPSPAWVAPTDLARVVSARRDEKGRSRVRVCRGGRLEWVELQKRDTHPHNAALAEASRFDLLEIKGESPTGTGVRLGPDATCHRVEG